MTTRKTTRRMGGTLALLALSVLAGCGGGNNDGGKGFESVVIPLTITPADATVARGAQQQFTASFPADAKPVWSVSSSDGSGSITSTGLYTAPNTPGRYFIQAYDANGSGYNGSVAVMVP